MTKHGADGSTSRKASTYQPPTAPNQEQTGHELASARHRAMRQPSRPPPLQSVVSEGRRLQEDNQHTADSGFSMENMSLELLAMLSPHGTTQQWTADEYMDSDDDGAVPPLETLRPIKPAASHKESAGKQQPNLDLTSPTEHIEPFAVSPASSGGVELDLLSPVALDEEELKLVDPISAPSTVQSLTDGSGIGSASRRPQLFEREASTTRRGPSTMPRQVLRANQSSHSQVRTPGRPNMASASQESRPKARHGGIYSLLLKNRPPEQEPTLVEDITSPWGPEASPSAYSSKSSPPPSMGKPQHGGIYALLRQNSHS